MVQKNIKQVDQFIQYEYRKILEMDQLKIGKLDSESIDVITMIEFLMMTY